MGSPERSHRRAAARDARKAERKGSDKAGKVYYGANCVYWTDNIGDLSLTKGGIPCCPTCGGVFFESSLYHWWESARKHAKKTNDKHYIEFLKWTKKKCYKTALEAAEAFAQVKREQDDMDGDMLVGAST